MSMRNYIGVVIVILMTVQFIHSTPECGLGSVKCSGQCDSPTYIQGCLTYKSKSQCEQCEHNYLKINGFCQFKPNSLSKCCLEFDYNGQCKKCTPGLVLNPVDKQCVDLKIPGCLEKNQLRCVNCAKNFELLNGTCVPKINGCKQYTNSGLQYICSLCAEGFELSKGQCGSLKWKNCQQSQCVLPFKLNGQKGKCQVPNCKASFQWGCIQCQQGYDLNRNGECTIKRIPGCIDYSTENQCRICEDSLYILFKGLCFPYGCLQLNQNLQCSNCNSKLGFVLQDGRCIIPNCAYAGINKCNICQEGRVWFRNQCVLQSSLDSTVCVTCPSSHFLNSVNECQKKQQGCAQYQLGSCTSCQPQYVYDSLNFKCVRRTPGCIYNQMAQCVSCKSQYTFNQNDKKCFIIGCINYAQNGRCSECSSFFKLNIQGFCSIQNCMQIGEQGCSKCMQNFQVSKDGICSPYDPHCIARNIFQKCIGCHEGYYLDSALTCKLANLGCNYIDGRCTSCKTPFTYHQGTSTCFIDGCKQYFFGGCQICHQSYQLRYNSCKLPQCLISDNGRCLQCNPDYIMRVKTNQCINKDQFCYEYNKDGECVECAPKYFMSKLQNKCQPREPGCVYDDQDKCSKCFAPFKPVLGQNKCYISGCLQHSLDNCKQCTYPFQLNDQKRCIIKNCLQNDDVKCLQCFGGYLLQNGLCTTGDSNCVQYNFRSGQCLKCKQGYKVINNKCQYQDSHCQTFTPKGHCSNCQRLYFLNPLNQCQLRDSNCQQYVSGYCTKCKPYFYYFNSLCYQNNQGCSVQTSIDKCQKCEDGYKLQKGKCNKQVTRLNWNSIQMDWFSSDNQKTKQKLQQTFTAGKQSKINLEPCIKSGYGRLFYSSDVQSTNNVCIGTEGNGWQPKSQLNQFVGVQVKTLETFYSVDIKCLTDNKMTSFTFEYLDKNTSKIFKKAGVYDLVCQSVGVIKTIYFTPVQALAVRIKVRKGLPNIKVQFYYNNRNYKVAEQPKDQTIIQQTIRQTIQASHQLLSNYCTDKELCWFGLQICEPRNITGFFVENDKEGKGKVNSVYVDYSVDGIQFTCYNQCNAIALNDGIVKFNKTVFGSKMRVHITDYQGQPKIRVKFDYK